MKKIYFVLTLTLFSILFSACSSKKKKDKKTVQAEIYYNEGTQLLYEKKYTQALNILLKAYEYSPKDDKINNNLGMAYFFKKNSRKAISHLRKAIKDNEKNLDAKSNLAFVYMELRNYEKAKKILKRISRNLTYQLQYRTFYNLAVIEIRQKNYKKANYYLDLSLNEKENYCPSLYWKAKIEVRKKNFVEAAKKFEDASTGVCYDNPEILYFKAVNHVRLRKIGDARILFNQIIDRFPSSAAAKKSTLQLSLIKNKYDNDTDYISSKYLKLKSNKDKNTFQPIE